MNNRQESLELHSLVQNLSYNSLITLKDHIKHELSYTKEDIIITISNRETSHRELALGSQFFHKYNIEEPYEGHPVSVLVDVLFCSEHLPSIHYISKGSKMPYVCTVFKEKIEIPKITHIKYNNSHLKLPNFVRERPDNLFRDLEQYAKENDYTLNITYAESVLPKTGPYRLKD